MTDYLQELLNDWPIEVFDAVFFIGEDLDDHQILHGYIEKINVLIPLMGGEYGTVSESELRL